MMRNQVVCIKHHWWKFKYIVYRWRLSSTYGRLIELYRGYGGFTGTANEGYPFDHYLRSRGIDSKTYERISSIYRK